MGTRPARRQGVPFRGLRVAHWGLETSSLKVREEMMLRQLAVWGHLCHTVVRGSRPSASEGRCCGLCEGPGLF